MGCLREDTWLCRRCSRDIQWQPTCIVCQAETGRGLTCRKCQDQTALHGAVAVGAYGNITLSRGVGWLKFKGIAQVAEVMARLLVPKLLMIAPLDVLKEEALLVPVPLHQKRLRWRGYNQSELIAIAVSKFTGIPVNNLAQRERATMTQTKLPSQMRGANMEQAFGLARREPLNKKYYLIIDDVTTTGATLSAVAEVLREGQPAYANASPYAKASEDKSAGRQIWGVTVARG